MSSSTGTARRNRQIAFRAPNNRTEILWAQHYAGNEYRLLNVPVWTYGVSVGSLFRARERPDGVLSFVDIVEPSPGATVRVLVGGDPQASDVYLKQLGPRAQDAGFSIGPATFFDPMMIAIHVKDRSQWGDFGEFLNTLIEEEIIDQWETGDPDEYADQAGEEEDIGSELVYPEPIGDRSHVWALG